MPEGIWFPGGGTVCFFLFLRRRVRQTIEWGVYMTLQVFFDQNPRVALAFSGGVDSAYLLYAAQQCGAQARAYFARLSFQLQLEADAAARLLKGEGRRRQCLTKA